MTPPEYIKDSMNAEMEKIIIDGRELTNIYIKFKAYDAIGINHVYCEIANNTTIILTNVKSTFLLSFCNFNLPLAIYKSCCKEEI